MKEIKQREKRSKKYQSFFHEVPREIFDTDKPIQYNEQHSRSEEFLDITEQITKLIWSLIDQTCTPTQLENIELIKNGATQHEVATQLEINQSSVVKTLQGNTRYYSDGGKKGYGGAFRKIRGALILNDQFRELCLQLQKVADKE
jgi:DNA-binding CsgD family transcriptional regulator